MSVLLILALLASLVVFLVQCGKAQLDRLSQLTEAIAVISREAIAHSREQLAYYGNFIPLTAQKLVETSRLKLKNLAQALPLVLNSRLDNERVGLHHKREAMKQAVTSRIDREKLRLEALGDKLTLLSPQNTLNRGYSLTTVNGHVITSATAVAPGDRIVTALKDGSITSTVN